MGHSFATIDELGEGYGHSTKTAEAAVEELSAKEGLELETTYSGKAAAALFQPTAVKESALFWLTYSTRRTTNA